MFRSANRRLPIWYGKGLYLCRGDKHWRTHIIYSSWAKATFAPSEAAIKETANALAQIRSALNPEKLPSAQPFSYLLLILIIK